MRFSRLEASHHWGRALMLLVAVLLVQPAAAWNQTGTGVRLLAVATSGEAATLRVRILAGESFDRLAREESLEPSAARGGYLGPVAPGDLRREFREALEALGPGEVSAPVRVGGRYYLLGLLTPAEDTWITAHEDGIRSVREGRYREAAIALGTAREAAESFGADDPRLAETLTVLADLHHLIGNFTLARDFYMEILDLGGEDPGPDRLGRARLLNSLAETLRLLGNPAGAEPYYRRALTLLENARDVRPLDRASVLGNLALNLRDLGALEEAESRAREAFGLVESGLPEGHPALATGLENLAGILEARGALADAEEARRRALALIEASVGPSSPFLADALVGLGRLVALRRDYDEALQLGWRGIWALWNVSDPEAREAVRTLSGEFTDLLLASSFGEALYGEAWTRFRRGLESVSPMASITVALADLLLESGLTAEGETLLRETAASFPGSGALHIRLADRHAEAGRAEEALAEFRAALPLARNEADSAARTEQLAYIHERLGDLLAEAGSFGEALESYESALAVDPASAGARVGAALLKSRSGLNEDALADYEAVLALDAAHAEAGHGIAQVYLGLERFDEAIEAAKRVLEIEPDHSEAWFVLSRSLLRSGRQEEGQAALARYQDLEAARLDAESARLDRLTLFDEAASAVSEEKLDEAAVLYGKAIESHPETPDFYLDLAVLLGRLGRHGESVETLERMLTAGFDDFRVHRALATEYGLISDPESAVRHETLHVLGLYRALREKIR